jgi:hypothetical protein
MKQRKRKMHLGRRRPSMLSIPFKNILTANKILPYDLTLTSQPNIGFIPTCGIRSSDATAMLRTTASALGILAFSIDL